MDDTGRTPPIEEQEYIAGIKVVDIGDYRVARGLSRREFSTCPHKQMVYDERERRIWCRDCERDIEPFDAFTKIVGNVDTVMNRLKAQKERLEEAERFQIRSLAAKAMDEAWRKRSMVPACPTCSNGLFPEDFKNGVSMLGREYAEARRLANDSG